MTQPERSNTPPLWRVVTLLAGGTIIDTTLGAEGLAAHLQRLSVEAAEGRVRRISVDEAGR